jgi:hypothetical protein
MSSNRTGRLVTLLPTREAHRRRPELIHAAEEIEMPYPPGVGAGGTFTYPASLALCGAGGRGAANRPLSGVTCRRCTRTLRYRVEVDRG